MFIEIKDYLIPVDIICYIKRIGQGLRIVTKAGTIDIATYSDEDYEFLKLKLCGETWKPEDILTNVKPEEENNTCKEYCKDCKEFGYVNIDGHHFYTCSKRNRKVLCTLKDKEKYVSRLTPCDFDALLSTPFREEEFTYDKWVEKNVDKIERTNILTKEEFYNQLGETWKPEDALCNLADKVAKEDEETRRLLAESKEVMSMKLCNRKSCEGCEHIQTIENPIDNTEPHIFICKMMRKEVLDNYTSLPTPYDFYKSEYHYEEEKK